MFNEWIVNDTSILYDVVWLYIASGASGHPKTILNAAIANSYSLFKKGLKTTTITNYCIFYIRMSQTVSIAMIIINSRHRYDCHQLSS